MACEPRCDGGNGTSSLVHCAGVPLDGVARRLRYQAGQPALIDGTFIDEGI
ncbi:hypothetical protein RKD35_006765 [Streptomyces albogriseolus]